MAHAIEYRRLRAPREHGQALIDPPLAEAAALVAHNRSLARAEHGRVMIGGVSLAELSAQARRALGCNAEQTIILSGHQPELYHPGVWFKNFVLSALGQQHQAAAINLVIDNDTVGAPAIRVPRGDSMVETVPLDDAAAELPYEERPVINAQCFRSFAVRVNRPGTLVERLDVFPEPPARLGAGTARARHALETESGLCTREMALSEICDQESFHRFALHLLLELPRLQAIFNASLAEFRRVHHVRSRSHPVPELTRDGEWLEAPLWIWSEQTPTRRPLFVKRAGDQLMLRSDAVEFSVPLTNGVVTSDTVAALRSARQRGIKLRPRALITTMYARLTLSDLFLHGIGGAKYDQLTDAIIERFFGITPPRFMTVTATMQLQPMDVEALRAQLRAVEHQLRELPFHPERFARADTADFEALRAEKEKLITDPPPKGQRKAWHQAIARLNERLSPFAAAPQQELLQQRDELAQQLQRAETLGAREFSFCLFDESLIDSLKRLAGHK
jgi:hypothetical protein